MAAKTKFVSILGGLAVLIVLVVGAAVDFTTSEHEQPQQCHSYTYCHMSPPPRAKKLVLFINAANGDVDWERVNSLGVDWEVRELVLEGFGRVMWDRSFTAALEGSYETMRETLEGVRPDVLLVSSKGVGVIAYLASKRLWVDRAVILFSPIPNPIDGLVDGTSLESEWRDTIDALRRRRLGPILVAVGSSPDEEVLITEAMQELSACGEISEETGTFERCTDWRHVVVPGDHGWCYGNEDVVSSLISYMLLWLEREKQR